MAGPQEVAGDAEEILDDAVDRRETLKVPCRQVEFVPTRPWQIYCSDRCRTRVQRERRAELLQRVLPDDPGRPE